MAAPAALNERLAAVDYIKAAAIIAVVVTHAGPAFWDPKHAPLDWALRISWTSFHVPSFLVVAGFLYARRQPIALREIGGRLRRIVVPYLVASAVAWLGGWWAPRSLRMGLWELGLSRTMGIYYFIGMLALCIAAAWPISRLGVRSVFAVLALLLAAGIASEVLSEGRLMEWIFWNVAGLHLALLAQEVLYPLAAFLVGWLARLHRERLAGLLERAPWAVLAAGLAGIGAWLAAFPAQNTFEPVGNLARLVYTLAVIAVITVATRAASVPRAVRFLSEASLGLYLFHIFFELALERQMAGWPPLQRIPLAIALPLLGGVAVCVLARRLLGNSRARAWIGA